MCDKNYLLCLCMIKNIKYSIKNHVILSHQQHFKIMIIYGKIEDTSKAMYI